MPPRSIWNGAVAFGAVNVPIKVFGALEDKAIRFRELHAKDGSEVGHRLIDQDGKEVPRERVVKGYEISEGEYVVLSNDEIKAADQPARKAIELGDFVPADQIDPVFYGKPYMLAPQDGAEEAYALLVKALEKAERVGIGRVSLRQREQLVSVRPVDGLLRMQIMRFADELVDGDKTRRRRAVEEARQARDRHGRDARRDARREVRARPLRGHLPRARAGGRQGEGEGRGDLDSPSRERPTTPTT